MNGFPKVSVPLFFLWGEVLLKSLMAYLNEGVFGWRREGRGVEGSKVS